MSLGTFCPLGRYVLGTFCPWDILSLGRFVPWDVLSRDVLSVHLWWYGILIQVMFLFIR